MTCIGCVDECTHTYTHLPKATYKYIPTLLVALTAGQLARPLLRFSLHAFARSLSVDSQPASAKSHVPCSQACEMQSIVSDLPWLPTTNPCWRHARDAFLQRHASPSSQSTGFENKSTVRARDIRCAAGESSSSYVTLVFPGFPTRMPYFGEHVWRACDSILLSAM